jgi:hypothetical protein
MNKEQYYTIKSKKVLTIWNHIVVTQSKIPIINQTRSSIQSA